MKVKLKREVVTTEVYTLQLSEEETKEFSDLIGNTYQGGIGEFMISAKYRRNIFDYISRWCEIDMDEVSEINVKYRNINTDRLVDIDVVIIEEELEELNPNWPNND